MAEVRNLYPGPVQTPHGSGPVVIGGHGNQWADGLDSTYAYADSAATPDQMPAAIVDAKGITACHSLTVHFRAEGITSPEVTGLWVRINSGLRFGSGDGWTQLYPAAVSLAQGVITDYAQAVMSSAARAAFVDHAQSPDGLAVAAVMSGTGLTPDGYTSGGTARIYELWFEVFGDFARRHQPPQRKFPRDDGLAGSPSRAWPRPRSRQRGNRAVGGHL